MDQRKLQKAHCCKIGDFNIKISFDTSLNENNTAMNKLLNRLKAINLEDRKKRSFRRKVSKARKNRVKQKIDFGTIEIFRLRLTNLLITVTQNEMEINVQLKNIVNNIEIDFPLRRWKKLEGYSEEISNILESSNDDEYFEKRHLGGGMYVEVDSGKLNLLYWLF